MHEPKRYLGLELAGAKNQKTALAVLEFYPKERKVFLLDTFERIVAEKNQTGDEAILALIHELTEELDPADVKMGVNVPLQLPPCLGCERKACVSRRDPHHGGTGIGHCADPTVRWMHDFMRRAARGGGADGVRAREFTPYTQRPVELWVRYRVLPRLPESHRFEIDETMGGNKAPLTARMDFLKRQLGKLRLAEAWPKLTIAVLALEAGLNKRAVARYRQLEDGILAREEILEALTERHGVFIYDRDLHKLAASLSAFDAFVCAYTALLSDTERCTKLPVGYPSGAGWVEYPRME